MFLTKILPTQSISFGQYQKKDMPKFKHDLFNSKLLKGQASSLGPLYDQYSTILSRLIDIHAPLKLCHKTSQVVYKRNKGSKSFQIPPRADLETYKIS